MAKFALWVTCKACRFVFDSSLVMDQTAFDRGTLAANYHSCPRCGTRATYRKADYELRPTGPARR